MTFTRVTRQLIVPAALALLCTLEAAPARAQQDNTATVEALFADGKKLMAAGKFSEACPKFLASYNLEHRVGTVLNLAACYEKNGQIASAWARFVEAKTLAARANQAERASFAAQHATQLEPRRSMLTITVDQPPAGLVVRRDGVVVDAAVYGIAVPVDGGAHAIEVSAPDKKAVAETVTVKTEGDAKTFAVPTLADEPHAPKAVAAGEGGANGAVTGGGQVTTTTPAAHSSTRMIVGLGVAGVGVIAAGIGAAFGVEALSKNSSSNANGACVGNVCDAAGYADRNTARSDGNVSSVLIGVGAAAIVGGLVVWLTAPKGEAAGGSGQVVVGIGPTGLDVKGVF